MKKEIPKSYIVCKCKQVTLGEIIYAIKEKKANNLQKIAFYTDAGTVCGSCKSKEDDIMEKKLELYLDEILKKFIKE